MKMFLILFILATSLSFQTKAQDYPVAAREYCDCFKRMKDTMDAEFRLLLIRVAKQPNVKDAFTKEMNGLDATKQRRLGEQLQVLGGSMDSEDTESGRCGIALDKKYEEYIATAEKEMAFTKKLITELSKNKDCEFLWAVSIFALAFSDDD